MRRSLAILVASALGILMASTAYLYARYRDASAAEQSIRANYAEAVSAITEIQTDLNAIDLGTEDMRLIAGGTEMGSLPLTRRDQITGRIADLRKCVAQSREKIGRLEHVLSASRERVGELEQLVDGLKATLARKEMLVDLLSARADSLQVEVAELEAEALAHRVTIAEQRRTIEQKRRELSTIYYLVGSKSELRDKGVIVERGGLLGIGKTARLTASYDPSLFTPLDVDRERIVQAPSTKVEVLSAHPAGSYEIRVNADNAEVRIVDPERFRTVKHLVIMAG